MSDTETVNPALEEADEEIKVPPVDDGAPEIQIPSNELPGQNSDGTSLDLARGLLEVAQQATRLLETAQTAANVTLRSADARAQARVEDAMDLAERAAENVRLAGEEAGRITARAEGNARVIWEIARRRVERRLRRLAGIDATIDERQAVLDEMEREESEQLALQAEARRYAAEGPRVRGLGLAYNAWQVMRMVGFLVRNLKNLAAITALVALPLAVHLSPETYERIEQTGGEMKRAPDDLGQGLTHLGLRVLDIAGGKMMDGVEVLEVMRRGVNEKVVDAVTDYPVLRQGVELAEGLKDGVVAYARVAGL